jgi:branched-chain amino acid aminotransferase
MASDFEDLTVYFNGAFVPWADAHVHVFSPAVKYGAGVFEGICAYNSDAGMNIFRLQEHLARLEYSQHVMRFDRVFTAEEFTGPIIELVKRNGFQETVHIRPTVYVDGEGESGALGPIGMCVTAVQKPRPAYVEKGCRVQVSSWQRLSDISMPTRVKAHANYNNSRFASTQAKTDGYDTALMLNAKGHVAEGPGMCFFMVRNGVPITPSITSNILESITRDTVLQLCRDELGIEPVERDVDRSELYAAEEAFFCGTAWEITPITNIDGHDIGDGIVGPLTRKLQSVYFDLIEGRAEDTRGWLTPA